ncbi:MAG: class I SAM-dependent methyltransferase [Flavobacteriia bacterium]|nr:MAG: class I SAM-dependent methyltransferase [Flavobacteriia bacterium]
MNSLILDTEVQLFINKHLYDDPVKLILKGSPFPEVSAQELAEQIISKKKCKTKLPTWFVTDKIYYPNKLNIEQTSSEITAKYKADLIYGDNLLDITGGFGVDDLAFAERFSKVLHCEIDKELSEIVAHNYKRLGVNNIKTIADNGLNYLARSKEKFDWIYSDPSRRNKTKERVFLLKDCLPDIPENLDLLFEHADQILIKVSPVLDISSTISELKSAYEIHVLAVNNEVKELLFLLKKDYSGQILIKTINIKKDTNEVFQSIYNSSYEPTYFLPESYLYEPNPAILKAGLFNEVSNQLNIHKLHSNSHLYTSRNLTEFPGRRFRILQITPYDKKQLKRLIPSKKANITVRNFPETVAQIRKRTGFKEGGDLYLFFTTDLNNKHVVLICEKVIQK